MARAPPLTYRYPSLENAPKAFGQPGNAGPPPSYRTNTTTETDSWSDSSSGFGKRRSSWTNLVDSSENLNKYRVNHYPKVYPANSNKCFYGSAAQLGAAQGPVSRQNSLTTMSEVVQVHAPKGALPVFSEPVPISLPPLDIPSPAAQSRPSGQPAPKRNRLQELKKFCCRPWLGLLLITLVLLVIIGIVLAIVLTQAFAMPKNLMLNWQAPEALRGGQTAANQIQMDALDNERVRLQLRGSMPLKGSFITYYDFKTGKVVIIDESLKSNGRLLACFVSNFDKQNIPDMGTLQTAASNAQEAVKKTGWQPAWNYVPMPLNAQSTAAQFVPPIPECANAARWVQLDYTSADQKQQPCSECHEICLPNYGIEMEDSNKKLNILNQMCFRLFVPEYRSYAQSNSIEQNQRDFEAFYQNRNGQSNGAGARWIPLSGVPTQPTMPSAMMGGTHVPMGGMSSNQGQLNNNQGSLYQFLPQVQLGQLQPLQGGFGPLLQSTGLVSNQANMNNNQQQQQQQQQQNQGFIQRPIDQVTGVVSNLFTGGANLLTGVNDAATGVRTGLVNMGAEAARTAGQTTQQLGGVFGQTAQGLVNMVLPGQQNQAGTAGYGGIMNNGFGGAARPDSSGQQMTYPGGFLPDLMRSVNVEGGIPGVSGVRYGNEANGNNGFYNPFQPGQAGMAAPQSISPSDGQFSQNVNSNQGVVGMRPGTGTGYVPDVIQSGLPQNQNQQFGRMR